MRPLPAEQGVGRQLDLELHGLDGVEAWGDVTIGHSYNSVKQFNWHIKRQELAAKLWHQGTTKMLPCTSMSPVAEANMLQKHHKYGKMRHIAHVQYLLKQRKSLPRFYGLAITHGGEWSTDTIRAMEWITMNYKASVSKGKANYNGIDPKIRTAQFRKRLRDALQVAAATSLASIVIAASVAVAG